VGTKRLDLGTAIYCHDLRALELLRLGTGDLEAAFREDQELAVQKTIGGALDDRKPTKQCSSSTQRAIRQLDL
jgi:hypothetical protein